MCFCFMVLRNSVICAKVSAYYTPSDLEKGAKGNLSQAEVTAGVELGS